MIPYIHSVVTFFLGLSKTYRLWFILSMAQNQISTRLAKSPVSDLQKVLSKLHRVIVALLPFLCPQRMFQLSFWTRVQLNGSIRTVDGGCRVGVAVAMWDGEMGCSCLTQSPLAKLKIIRACFDVTMWRTRTWRTHSLPGEIKHRVQAFDSADVPNDSNDKICLVCFQGNILAGHIIWHWNNLKWFEPIHKPNQFFCCNMLRFQFKFAQHWFESIVPWCSTGFSQFSKSWLDIVQHPCVIVCYWNISFLHFKQCMQKVQWKSQRMIDENFLEHVLFLRQKTPQFWKCRFLRNTAKFHRDIDTSWRRVVNSFDGCQWCDHHAIWRQYVLQEKHCAPDHICLQN